MSTVYCHNYCKYAATEIVLVSIVEFGLVSEVG